MFDSLAPVKLMTKLTYLLTYKVSYMFDCAAMCGAARVVAARWARPPGPAVLVPPSERCPRGARAATSDDCKQYVVKAFPKCGG